MKFSRYAIRLFGSQPGDTHHTFHRSGSDRKFIKNHFGLLLVDDIEFTLSRQATRTLGDTKTDKSGYGDIECPSRLIYRVKTSSVGIHDEK